METNPRTSWIGKRLGLSQRKKTIDNGSGLIIASGQVDEVGAKFSLDDEYGVGCSSCC